MEGGLYKNKVLLVCKTRALETENIAMPVGSILLQGPESKLFLIKILTFFSGRGEQNRLAEGFLVASSSWLLI